MREFSTLNLIIVLVLIGVAYVAAQALGAALWGPKGGDDA